uniref:Uncharacterized protein n=1 Tax=Heliothis virescens TaxID=7102 RepID=A0A2A4IW01_HELVI
MRCLILIFALCFIRKFTDGQGIMEEHDEEPDTNGIVFINEKLQKSGDESTEAEIPGEAVFRGDTVETDFETKDNENNDNESSLEANTEATESEGEDKNSVQETDKKVFDETMKKFAYEMAAGDTADLIGQNHHLVQATMYNELGRRFVPQYKYTGAFKAAAAEHNEDLVPEKAPPELVLVVAKESALLGPDKGDVDNDVDQKKILRSGDYWDGVWKEEIVPKSTLRSGTEKKVLGSIKAKVKPGSEFYKVVSRMKKISPRLLYIINKKQL